MSFIYPQHVAIIPDGNRTRAKLFGKLSHFGHHAGFKNAIDLANYVFEHTPIKAFTLWWLSTENLKERGKEELQFLFSLFKMVADDLRTVLIKHRVSFKRVWDVTGLPQDLVDYLNAKQQELTFEWDKHVLLCINYGGRNEIIRGIKKRATTDGNIDDLDEQTFGKYLDFDDIPAVDLVIRTKGELASRISGFMLWRIGYAELFFSKLHFPAFGIEALKEALQRFHDRSNARNFGK